jgi:amino acid transporter
MDTKPQVSLRRSINLPLLSFYGIGTILGAGIYVLIGKVAGYAGMQTPLAFLIAAFLAGLTAFSYAELSNRYPKSAGEAIYIQEGFHVRRLSILVGLLIVTIGITSTATLLNGLIGYLHEFISLPGWLIICASVFIMAAVVSWGIGESVIVASIMTVVEILGLLIIIWVARDSFGLVVEKAPELLSLSDTAIWSGVLLGGFVAFYAFIGFEDMVNIAEEIKQPEKNLPRGILIALIVTTVFYILVALVSVLSGNVEQLAKSNSPLAWLYKLKTGEDPYFISLISIVSIFNGALIQVVMGSRILYGMSNMGWLPKVFSSINRRTRTPIPSILTVSVIILMLALWLPLLSLAKLTSFITLTIFALINLALWRVKLRKEKHKGFSIPAWVPLLGAFCCGSFVIYQLIQLVVPK